jgi:hypothetical protein
MAEEVKKICDTLGYKKLFPKDEILAIYGLPKEFTIGIEDINYEKGQIVAKIPVSQLANKIVADLDKKENILIYLGKGAIEISPGSKVYHMLDVPLDMRPNVRDAMAEIGYVTEDDVFERAKARAKE